MTGLATATMRAVVGVEAIAETLVVTPDDEVRGLALAAGARPMRQRSSGLNAGLREARDEAIAGGADAVLIVPIDLPDVTIRAIADIVAVLAAAGATARRHRPGSARPRDQCPAAVAARCHRRAVRRR